MHYLDKMAKGNAISFKEIRVNSRRIVQSREGWEGRRGQGGEEGTWQILAEVSDHGKPI